MCKNMQKIWRNMHDVWHCMQIHAKIYIMYPVICTSTQIRCKLWVLISIFFAYISRLVFCIYIQFYMQLYAHTMHITAHAMYMTAYNFIKLHIFAYFRDAYALHVSFTYTLQIYAYVLHIFAYFLHHHISAYACICLHMWCICIACILHIFTYTAWQCTYMHAYVLHVHCTSQHIPAQVFI